MTSRSSTKSYTLSDCLKLVKLLENYSRVKRKLNETQSILSERLPKHASSNSMVLYHTIELKICQNTCDNVLRNLKRESDICDALSMANHQRETTFAKNVSALHADKGRYVDRRAAYFSSRERYLKTNAHLTLRRRQLLSELACWIYPISIPSSDFPVSTISGIKLPNSETLIYTPDDEALSVALGYTLHLLLTICQILDVSVRYTIIHQGSRSTIVDPISSHLPAKRRTFPLHCKASEKQELTYGVWLLNKNIAQLRFYCELPMQSLSHTLPNLAHLLAHLTNGQSQVRPAPRSAIEMIEQANNDL